jgi:thioredoxin 1
MRVVEVNADENLVLASRYRLRMLPTLLVMWKGQVQHRLEQFQSRDQLYHQLQQAVQAVLAAAPIVSV